MKNNNNCLASKQASVFQLTASSCYLLVFALLLSACSRQDLPEAAATATTAEMAKGGNGHVSNATVMAWNDVSEKMYYSVGAPPPVLSRTFAMIQVAMHDALNGIKPKFETYAYKGATDKDADPDAAVSQAAYRMLVALQYPGQSIAPAETQYAVSMAAISNGDGKTKGIALGNAVADALLAKRNPDLPSIVVLGHPSTPANGTMPGEYRYLPPLGYALGGFDQQQTWVIQSSTQFRPATIYGKTNVTEAVATPHYATDYEELRQYGRQGVSLRTPDQSEIGVFWAENSSKGWNAVSREVIKSRPANSMDAWKTARLLALTQIAVADAYIAVFDGKIFFNFWRPVSAVQLGDADGNPQTVGEPAWEPVLGTPAVGEFPSAHAMSGAAAGQVLRRYFDKDQFDMVLTSEFLPGVVRKYSSINAAIHDNSLSRIYIGFHFRHAVEVGEAAGYQLGDYVFEHGLPEN